MIKRSSLWPNAPWEIRECLIGPTAAEAVKFGAVEADYDRFYILTIAQNKEHSLLNFTALRYCNR